MTSESANAPSCTMQERSTGPLSRIIRQFHPRLAGTQRKHVLLLGDLILVNGTLLLSVTVWNQFALSPAAVLSHAKWFITLSGLWLIIGTILDIYNLARAASTTSIMASVISATMVTSLSYLIIPWLTPPILHRTYAVGFVLVTTGTLVGWRVLYARALVQPAFRQRGLFVGHAGPALTLAKVIHQAAQGEDANPFRGTGYEIVGRVADELNPADGDTEDDTIPLLGGTRHLVRLIRQLEVDEVILAPEDERQLPIEARETLLDCRELGLRITNLASVYERLTGRLPVEYAQCDLDLLLGPTDSPAFRLYAASKRLMDLTLALLGLAALTVVVPLTALTNALWSPGPLFYRQQRLGKGGRPFSVIKLRSMVRDAERYSGAVWCEQNDPRITPVGRLLRKTRLDELPQILNVLRGEMSFVGPRPERPHFVGDLARSFPLYRARHAVKPGITGWAQVHHEYGDSVEDARVKLEYDLYYVKHASLYLDLLTLLHTVRVVVGAKGQ